MNSKVNKLNKQSYCLRRNLVHNSNKQHSICQNIFYNQTDMANIDHQNYENILHGKVYINQNQNMLDSSQDIQKYTSNFNPLQIYKDNFHIWNYFLLNRLNNLLQDCISCICCFIRNRCCNMKGMMISLQNCMFCKGNGKECMFWNLGENSREDMLSSELDLKLSILNSHGRIMLGSSNL